MKPAQPVNAQSTAVGVSIRKVIVEQIVPDKGIAIVRDDMQYTTQIPYRVQQGRGRVPRVGDYWYVDRSMGPWTFSAYIGKDDDDLTTFSEKTTFSDDIVVQGDVSVSGVGQTLITRQNADLPLEDATMIDSGLAVTLTPSAYYEISGMFFYSAHQDADMRQGWSYPASAWMDYATRGLSGPEIGSSGPQWLPRVFINGINIFGGPTTNNTVQMSAELHGLMYGGDGGVLRARVAQGTANATDSILRQGSFLIFRRVPSPF